MATQYAFGQIVTNGLVLSLDAADKNSYPGSGTNWYDLSENNKSGSLTNGPTFSSGNGGSIVFDGVDDYSNNGYISKLYNTKTITYNIWLKWGTLGVNKIIIGNENQIINPGLGIRQRSNNTYWMNPGIGSSNILSASPGVDTTKVHMITATTNGSSGSFYVNSQLVSSAAYSTTFTSQTDFYIGIGYTFGQPTPAFVEPFLGNIYIVQVYSRTLSTDEIMQNYNAQKSRFNL